MDENTVTSEPVVEPAQSEGGSLRAKLEETIAENRKLKAREMSRSFEALKLEADKGLGKAIAKEYDGEPTLEAIAQYAKDEYGYEPPSPEEQSPMAQQIAQEQAALDQVGSTAGSVIQPTEQEILAKAEAEGDVDTAFAIKSRQVEDFFRNQ